MNTNDTKDTKKRKFKEMQQKKWWSYATLAAGIFLFAQGCSVISNKFEYATPLIFFSLFMHHSSLKDLSQRFFKTKPVSTANTAMISALFIIAIICYFTKLNINYIVLLNMVTIALYFVVSALSLKSINKN